MKAQISFVEYLVAFSVFVTFVAYIFFRLVNFMPIYREEIKDELIRSETYQISELLINDPGDPVNWNSLIGVSENQIKRIGLSDSSKSKTNFLSVDKINALRAKCPVGGYGNELKNWIDTEYQFSLILTDKTGGVPPLDCHPPQVISKRIKASIRRVVAFDSGYGELVLQVW